MNVSSGERAWEKRVGGEEKVSFPKVRWFCLLRAGTEHLLETVSIPLCVVFSLRMLFSYHSDLLKVRASDRTGKNAVNFQENS